MARVLKAKYFPNSSFWEARRPSGASIIWKSICDARCVLERGTRWRIGNGQSVSVWQDRWLPRPIYFKPMTPCVNFNLVNLKVSDLLLSSGSWNEQLVSDIFLPIDAEIICNLPLSRLGGEDKWIWHFDRFGRYTTKIGYHVAKAIRD